MRAQRTRASVAAMISSDSADPGAVRRRRVGLRRDALALLAGLAIGAATVFAIAPAHAGACRAPAGCGMMARR